MFQGYDPTKYRNFRILTNPGSWDIQPNDVILSMTTQQKSCQYDNYNSNTGQNETVGVGQDADVVVVVASLAEEYENKALAEAQQAAQQRASESGELRNQIQNLEKQVKEYQRAIDKANHRQETLRGRYEDLAKEHDKFKDLLPRYENDIEKLRKFFGEKAMNEALGENNG